MLDQGRVTMRYKLFFASSICTVALCTAVSAQETKPIQGAATKQSNVSQASARSQVMVTPQMLATCLALDNQEAVVLSQFAQERIKNKEVKDLAQMISEEHQACLKKLAKFAPEASREGFLSETSAAPSTPRTEAGIDMVQLQREIAQQCIVDSKKYLSAKEGNEFDKCFVAMQIAKHAAMHTKLVVLQRHVSEEMQPLVTEGIEKTAQHLKAAEGLMAKLQPAK
jgi:predicted outer membrane protein